ncbi:hypothetical protein BH09PSE4_BH09PSE4_11790 [soil metagenome]
MRGKRIDRWRLLLWGCGTALAVSFALSLFTPIYTDEIGWRFQLARSPFDGGVDRYIAPSCNAPLMGAPWWMQPLRWFSAWSNALFAEQVFVRLLGVAMAVAAIALALGVTARASGDAGERRRLSVLVLGAAGIGLLPFLLVWSRPEQPILICVTGTVMVALRARRARVACGVVLLLGVIALGYHLKAIFYLPVFLAAIGLAAREEKAPAVRIGAAVLLLTAGASAFHYWSVRFQCPGDPLIDAGHRADNLGAVLTAPGGGPSWRLLWEAMRGATPAHYVESVLPGAVHMAPWIAPRGLPGPVVGLWRGLASAGWWALLLAGLVAIGIGLADMVRERRIEPRGLLAAALALSLFGWAFVQLRDNDYEAALWLPLAALASVLVLSAAGARIARARGLIATVIGGVAIVSQLLLVTDYARLMPMARTPGFVAGQPHSFVPFGYDKAAIRRVGAMCGFSPATPRLVIDDLTYFAFQRSYRPIYAIGVFDTWKGSIGDPVAYLRGQGSPGAVTACTSLPPGMASKGDGHTCCTAWR